MLHAATSRATLRKERRLRDEITELWKGVEWDWFNATPQHDALYWHWSPDFGFHKKNRVGGWNETLMPYLLGHRFADAPDSCRACTTQAGLRRRMPRGTSANRARMYGITLAVADPNGTTGPLFFTALLVHGL